MKRVLGTERWASSPLRIIFQLDIPVAIKCLVPEALEYPEILARFAREAGAAASTSRG